jgi:dihydropteroate synthase
VRDFLAARARAAIAAGIPSDSIVLDPGLGFGKTVAQNAVLIDRTAEIAALGFPVLSGISRKSFVAPLSGLDADAPPRDRLPGSVALAVLHLLRGASIFRVHDVPAHRQALLAAWEAARR